MNQTIAAFGYPETALKEYDHWVVLLRPDQVTVGSVVIAAKSEVTRIGDMLPAEWEEFAQVTREFEDVARRTFNADKFNYFALMMKDPNVHFHAIPRYANPVVIGNDSYEDPDWPLKSELKPLGISDGS